MASRITQNKSGRMRFFLLWLFLFLLPVHIINAQELRQLTRDEFNSELGKAFKQNNEQRALSLIKSHRFFVKPFIDGIIKESITLGSLGKTAESKQLQVLAEQTASGFEQAFGEKSLGIAVNYLTIWSKEQKEMKLVGDSLSAAGTRFRVGKDGEKALESLQKALTVYGNIQDERGEADVLGGIGAVYFDNKDYQAALLYYKRALEKRVKVDDKVLMGSTLNGLGSVYYRALKDYPQALNFYDRAASVRSEIGDLAGWQTTQSYKAAVLRSLAEELNTMGKYPEAIEQLEKALEIEILLKSDAKAGETLSQMGFVYSNLGDNPSAISRLNQAVSLEQEAKDSVGLAGAYNHLGIVLQRSGRYEKALEYFTNSLKIFEKNQDQRNIFGLLNNLGTLYHDTRDYSKAEEYHLKALQKSRDIKDQVNEINCLINLANDQTMMGKPEEAILNYQPALAIAKSLKNPELIWKTFAGMAEGYESSGKYEKAVELNDSALKTLENLRNIMQREEFKISFMAKERSAFEDIINLLGILHEKDETKRYDELAFSYAERSKSRVLLDLLSGSDAVTSTPPVSLTEAQSMCPDKNTTLLVYSLGDSSSSMWIINGSGHRFFRIPDRKTLQDQVDIIRFSLLDPSQGTSEFLIRAGYFLYKDLIEPAEPYLSRKGKIIIVPDGILNYLPFEVLLTEKEDFNSENSFSNLPFLIRKHPLSYVQSVSVLKNLISAPPGSSKEESANKKLIAFGDPIFENITNIPIAEGRRLNRLEYTGTEVERIASLFGRGSADIFLRDKATENNLKLGLETRKYNYLHFATHGFIDEEKPELSSLLLTRLANSADDGLLQAAEISDLKLNADLVVLSACQTGLGKLIRGEGMIGLTRAFMYAGTPSVLVSLWSVSDISTAILMEEFYKNMVQHKLFKTDALRQAQLTLLSDEKFAHPFYWAPFVLFGNWR